MIRAAGILYQVESTGACLFLQRSGQGDAAGQWCFPGGKVEDGESPEEAAVRECVEEIGSAPKGPRGLVSRTVRPGPKALKVAPGPLEQVEPSIDEKAAEPDVDFTTFLQKVPEPFDVTLDGEHTAFTWAPFDQPPQPLHPGCEITLRRMASDELGVARMMAGGELTSPQFYENVALFDIRITGTNVAYRSAHEEFVYRDPANYLNDEFLARCNGLPVLWDHPSGSLLTSDEFAKRVVGTTFVPYVKGEDVWAIVKIYDDDAKKEMAKGGLSTSPAVNFSSATVFRAAADQNKKYTNEDGDTVLLEGKPSLLDHIAVCSKGVWDKGGPASGVNTAKADSEMTEDEKKADAAAKADAAKADQARKDADDRLEKVMNVLDSMSKRMDSYEEERKADKAKADKAKADADEEDKKKADKAKADAEEEKKANEAANEPGAGDPKEVERKAADKAKKDSDDEDEKKKADAAKADAAKADAARADSEKRMADMSREMEELKRRINASAPSDEDYASIAAAHSRADAVHTMFGGRASRHVPGETPLAYRRRLANELKDHSDTWKDFDLAALGNSAAFAKAEERIYADAAVAARNPAGLEPGHMRSMTRNINGLNVTEFFGQPRDWMGDFSPPKQVLRSFKPRM